MHKIPIKKFAKLSARYSMYFVTHAFEIFEPTVSSKVKLHGMYCRDSIHLPLLSSISKNSFKYRTVLATTAAAIYVKKVPET